jgi:hypothetical protein
MKKLIGVLLLVSGAWALVVPQANLGLQELRWMSRHAFPAEAILGSLLVTLGYLLLGEYMLQYRHKLDK